MSNINTIVGEKSPDDFRAHPTIAQAEFSEGV